VYDHAAPKNMLDKASVADWAAKAKAHPSGFTCHKFGFAHSDPATDRARDPSNRVLTTRELIAVQKGFENCRDALGWDHDLMVHCHWNTTSGPRFRSRTPSRRSNPCGSRIRCRLTIPAHGNACVRHRKCRSARGRTWRGGRA